MNPETKLTDEQMRAICVKHNIAYHSHVRITTGFSHEVHRLNNDLVVKLFDGTKPQNFETELAILKSGLDFPKPKFVASHQGVSEQDRSYIIMSFVPGISLGSKWHEATDAQREELIQDISQALIAINHLDRNILKQPSGTWQTTIGQRIEDLTAKLVARGTLTDAQAEKVFMAYSAHKKSLEHGELHPVYWDIHFDNFLVDEHFKLQAVIDLENVELTPLDYPLVVVQKLIDEPHKYLSEENEKYADVKDYAKLKEWYRKYYPEMFAFPHLDERIRLYLLIDTLHLLVNWAHVSELYDKLEMLTKSSTEFN